MQKNTTCRTYVRMLYSLYIINNGKKVIIMNKDLIFPPQIIYKALLNNYATIKNQHSSSEARNQFLLAQTIEDCKLEIMSHALKIALIKNINPNDALKIYISLASLRIIKLYEEIDFFKDEFENHLKMLIESENKHLPTKI